MMVLSGNSNNNNRIVIGNKRKASKQQKKKEPKSRLLAIRTIQKKTKYSNNTVRSRSGYGRKVMEKKEPKKRNEKK